MHNLPLSIKEMDSLTFLEATMLDLGYILFSSIANVWIEDLIEILDWFTFVLT